MLKNKDDGAKVDVLINTKYAPTLVNTSACAKERKREREKERKREREEKRGR